MVALAVADFSNMLVSQPQVYGLRPVPSLHRPSLLPKRVAKVRRRVAPTQLILNT